jgi:hypothetical protein
MTGINVARPQGRVPRVNPFTKPPGSAAIALDVDLDNGTLRPWRTPKLMHEASQDVLSFILADCCWLTWDKCVDAVFPYTPSCRQVVVTGAAEYPQIATAEEACAGDWCRLGVPCPPVAPQITTTSPLTNDETMAARAYRYTYLNRHGREGPGSPPSVIFQVNDGASVLVSGFEQPSAEWCVTSIRLYRLATPYETGLEQSNPQNTEFFFVAEFPASQTSYLDAARDIDLGNGSQGVFVTDEYLPPPADLHSIVSAENGFLAGISGNEVWICEPHSPHAWPLRFMKRFFGTPVALAACGAALYVATTERPYVIDLSDPANSNGVTPVKGPRVPLPCVSKRSMTGDTNNAYYASLDGLVALAGGEAKIISQSRLSERDWQELRPNRMIGHVRKGYYHGYTDIEGVRFRTLDQEHATIQDIGYTNLSERPTALWRSPTGELYYAQGRAIYLWNGGDRFRDYTWRSSPVVFPRRTALTAGVVTRSKSGHLTFALITDYGAIFQRQVDHSEFFRIKGAQNAIEGQIELRGTAEVFELSAGTTIFETARVEASSVG